MMENLRVEWKPEDIDPGDLYDTSIPELRAEVEAIRNGNILWLCAIVYGDCPHCGSKQVLASLGGVAAESMDSPHIAEIEAELLAEAAE
jgi:hypothetical protein